LFPNPLIVSETLGVYD